MSSLNQWNTSKVESRSILFELEGFPEFASWKRTISYEFVRCNEDIDIPDGGERLEKVGVVVCVVCLHCIQLVTFIIYSVCVVFQGASLVRVDVVVLLFVFGAVCVHSDRWEYLSVPSEK